MQIKSGMEAEYAEYVENNSKDGYSKGVVDFGEQWAKLMEERIAEGTAIKDIAEKASHDADTEGLTGFMYGCAVQAFARFWEHGGDLLKWHNRQYITDEAKADEATARGASVNPAILTIGA